MVSEEYRLVLSFEWSSIFWGVPVHFSGRFCCCAWCFLFDGHGGYGFGFGDDSVRGCSMLARFSKDFGGYFSGDLRGWWCCGLLRVKGSLAILRICSMVLGGLSWCFKFRGVGLDGFWMLNWWSGRCWSWPYLLFGGCGFFRWRSWVLGILFGVWCGLLGYLLGVCGHFNGCFNGRYWCR
ncbi:unnamed protein product [Amaranthus hypochondriacus]